jgi:hypothetical protein
MFDATPQGDPQPQPQPQQEPPRPITPEDIWRNQRANLSLRALDLEAEVILLQQENQRLQQRVAELTGQPVGSAP